MTEEYITRWVPKGEMNFDENDENISGAPQYYGTMTIQKIRPFRFLLEKYNSLEDLPIKFLGKYEDELAQCTQGNGTIELFDLNNILYTGELAPNNIYTVIINKYTKKTVFCKLLSGPYYKWETKMGVHLIFTQSDVDILTHEEKCALCII
jgi:hypothetical protein